MDISYLKNVYNFTLDNHSSGLLYFDKLSDTYKPVQHLSNDKYQLIYDLFLKFISNKENKKLFNRIDKSFNLLLNKDKKCFAPMWHSLTRSKLNRPFHTRNRIIIDSAQIIINDDFTQIIQIHHPNNSNSYSKFKKNKKDEKNKKNNKICTGCYPYFQPNQLAHMNPPNGCLYEDHDI
tara:strand:+ start:132 stop:665 length:534 start_codon:yes stop_codon:yes gene_type:complete